MTVTCGPRHMTYARMRGLMSYFTGLLNAKKVGLSDFIHRLSHHQLFHNMGSQKIFRSEGCPENLEEEALLVLPDSPIDTFQMKPIDFDYVNIIGKGSFGKVLLAQHKTSGIYYAVKVLHKKEILKRKEQTHVMAERNVLLKGLQHPFLVGLHFSFQTNNLLYFVLEYVNGGDLFYHLQKEGFFPEPRAAFYAAEMATALGYLHSLRIVYRDMKPENILLDREGHVMLTDFGLCKEGVAMEDAMHTFCGTPEYLAPEVLQGHTYSPMVDWWGLGTVLFEMLYGLPPFYSCSRAEMFEQIVHSPLKLAAGVSSAAQALLRGLLERDCSKRLGQNDDFRELQDHAFFVSINWEDLLARKVTPPFIPVVTGPCDVSYVDSEFTLQPIPASVGGSDKWQGGGANDTFLGFTYMPPV